MHQGEHSSEQRQGASLVCRTQGDWHVGQQCGNAQGHLQDSANNTVMSVIESVTSQQHCPLMKPKLMTGAEGIIATLSLARSGSATTKPHDTDAHTLS